MNVVGESGWAYEPPCDQEYRFLLGEIGQCPIICVGVNPSTARPDELDRTLKQVKRFSECSNEYSGWMMLNLYPQRATAPDLLDDEMDADLMAANYNVIRKVFREIFLRRGCVHVWCAWGGLIHKRPYLWQSVARLFRIGSDFNTVWSKRGQLTKKGDPHHPLYVRRTEILESFDLEKYLKQNSRIVSY